MSFDSTDTIVRSSFGLGDAQNLGSTPYILYSWTTAVAEITRVQLITPGIWTANGTATQPKLDDGNTLQDSSPFPASLVGQRFWNETVWWSSSQKNAVRFTVYTGVSISWFGAWFGDLETRTDGNWTPAEVYLFDQHAVLIDSHSIVPGIGDQSLCGWSNPSTSPSACGNETTRWIWFVSTQAERDRIKYIVVVVGDDDDSWDGGTTDGKTEHLSLIWPTFAFACRDQDEDGVCDSDDICPLDPVKHTWENICGCGNLDPDTVWDTCSSPANSCGSVGTWTIQCDGSCSAVVPDLPVDFGTVCQSDANVCGSYLTWTIQCDSTCSAWDSNTLLPISYGTLCISDENTCGIAWTGSVQCDGSCSAVIPWLPVWFGSSCTSWVNACGEVATWTIECDWSCNASIPNVVTWYAQICVSQTNNCGLTNTGAILCDGTCSALAPDDLIDCSCPDPHELFWEACTSWANICWEVGTWTIACDGTCDARIPDVFSWFGDVCVSEQNDCGIIGTWTIWCDTLCTAQVPDNSLCPYEEEITSMYTWQIDMTSWDSDISTWIYWEHEEIYTDTSDAHTWDTHSEIWTWWEERDMFVMMTGDISLTGNDMVSTMSSWDQSWHDQNVSHRRFWWVVSSIHEVLIIPVSQSANLTWDDEQILDRGLNWENSQEYAKTTGIDILPQDHNHVFSWVQIFDPYAIIKDRITFSESASQAYKDNAIDNDWSTLFWLPSRLAPTGAFILD